MPIVYGQTPFILEIIPWDYNEYIKYVTVDAVDVTGTGLGLWITRELIVMMNGEIYVDSIENRGTEITVLFSAIKK